MYLQIGARKTLIGVLSQNIFCTPIDMDPFSVRHMPQPRYIIKIEIHSSCEIACFVETHLCKLCVILRSRVLRVVCPNVLGSQTA